MNDYSIEIQNGVRLLDREFGRGWEHKISLRTLHVQKAQHCVVGQLTKAQSNSDYTVSLYGMGVPNGAPYGFELSLWDSRHMLEWWSLTRQWKKEIRRLRKQNRTVPRRSEYTLAGSR